MSAQLQIGGYVIEFDREATAACYARIPIPGPEACHCAYCRNWVAAREHVLPLEFRNLLVQFGIPTNGEIEVWETPGRKQPHFYAGWYFVVGRIVSGGPDHLFEVDGFHASFTSGTSYAVPAFEGQQICELNFYTEIDEFLSSQEEYKTLPGAT